MREMTKKLQPLAAVLCAAALTVSIVACGSAPAESEPAPTSSPTPTAAPEITPTLEPTASPAVDPTAAPTEVPEAQAEDIPVELQPMYPLIEAHMLAQLNGGAFDAHDPAYFWQTVCFAIDGCGLEFYSAETVGNALVLSRGVVEEIASGLFENGGVLPEIPETLSGELQYDAEADAYAHPLGGGGYGIAVRGIIDSEDGSLMLMVSLTAGDTDVADFSAEIVENTRAGNSLITYSIRSVKRQ